MLSCVLPVLQASSLLIPIYCTTIPYMFTVAYEHSRLLQIDVSRRNYAALMNGEQKSRQILLHQ